MARLSRPLPWVLITEPHWAFCLLRDTLPQKRGIQASIMAAAKLLKDVSLFIDGRGYASNVEDFDPPKLVIKTEEYRAGRMEAPVEVDMGRAALMATVTLSNADREALKLFGLAPDNPVPMTLRGS